MKDKKPYHLTSKNKNKSPIAVLRNVITLLVLSIFISNTSYGKDDPVFDEISVFITLPGLGSTEVPALIMNDNIYLAVANVFDFLQIKNTLSPGMDSVYGYFITPQSPYLLDKTRDLIIIADKIFYPRDLDMIKTETNLFLRSDFFGLAFGLNCTFNFRSLSVIVSTRLELPVIREMRLEAMRNNMNILKGDLKADTIINRSYPLFHFGMADWSVISTQNSDDSKVVNGTSNTRLNLALGGIVAGGETNIRLNYDNKYPFSEREQYYLWRLVDNDRRGLRQAMAGKINTQANASIFSPVVGVQFTNTPTTYRRSFGTYSLSDHTEPNWMVELYVNNVLVNYVKADASGFFTFEVPLVYGNSMVKLRYYGPFGEERFTEQNINIPFNFIPVKKFEYTVSAGVVEDTVLSRYSKINLNYGLGKRITIGGGVEYLSSVTTGKIMPFVNVSARLADNLLVASEYIHNVRLKNVLNYRLPSNLQFEFTYSRYKKGQRAINNSYLEERKAVVSYPFRGSKLSLFSRLTYYQIVLPGSKYTNVESVFSGALFGINANFTTYALFITEAKPYLYSNLSSTFRLPKKILFTPQVQYEYNQKKFISLRGELGKSISSHGYANIYYENNFKSQYQSIGIGFRYDFSFAQLSFFAVHGDHSTTTTEAARGSLMYNRATNFFGVNNRNSVGKGGLAIVPFLDLNANGKRDKNEPKVFGLTIQINAGQVKYNKRDTSIQVSDLEAYMSYIVKLNSDAFENVSWQILKKTYSIKIDPNQLRIIEVPVTIIGEVSGTVFLEEGTGKKVQGRILVNFYKNDSTLIGHTLTESDGFFNFSGLTRGSYVARIDPEQLKKLQMISTPLELPFTVSGNKDGDVIEDLEFVLQKIPESASAEPLENPR